MITVRKKTAGSFEVIVSGSRETRHTVTVDTDYYEQLTGGTSTCEELITKSFAFLLERESNTSILSIFNLKVISSYFPEYEEKMKKIFRSGS